MVSSLKCTSTILSTASPATRSSNSRHGLLAVLGSPILHQRARCPCVFRVSCSGYRKERIEMAKILIRRPCMLRWGRALYEAQLIETRTIEDAQAAVQTRTCLTTTAGPSDHADWNDFGS
jgi:hypothetical protein